MKRFSTIQQMFCALVCLLFTVCTPLKTVASEEEAPSSVGPGKAVTAISEKEGFQLSDKAQKRLKLQFLTLSSSPPYAVPRQSLVYSKFEVGVYRLRNGWFKFVEIEKAGSPSSSSPQVSIRSSELQAGDQIVTQGVGILRVVDLEVFGEHEEGHAH